MLRPLCSRFGRMTSGLAKGNKNRLNIAKGICEGYPKVRAISISAQRLDLMEFFDDKKHWGEVNVRAGRAWAKDELRIKSNTDLHKLWYVLLKERNMLFTMEINCKEACEHFPNPERIDKVEESMKNLEDVVRERNRAYFQLETGETGERPGEEEENFLGLPEYKQFEEHSVPMNENKDFLKAKSEQPVASREEKHWFLRHYREKQNNRKNNEKALQRDEAKRILRMFPNTDEEALKAKYPDANIERVIEKFKERHSVNIRPKHFKGHKNHF